jgi:hypothetical protein
MIVLGLLPPYTPDDVRMAHRELAKKAHPDHGGSADDFKRLQEAYERALEYVTFHSGRRQWLAAQAERYVDQEAAVLAVHQAGGQVELEEIDWLKRSIGEDFSILTDRLRGIRLRNSNHLDHFFVELAQKKPELEFLLCLDVAGSRLTDAGLGQAPRMPLLERLDLSKTQVTPDGVSAMLGALPNLRWLNIAGTPVNWWGRWRLRRSWPGVEIV